MSTPKRKTSAKPAKAPKKKRAKTAVELEAKQETDDAKKSNNVSPIDLFHSLVQHNLEFFNNRVEETTWHLGPLDAESRPLIDVLSEINKQGFLSVDSQPGLFETSNNKPKSAIWAYQYGPEIVRARKETKTVEVRQRAFLRGLMFPDLAKLVIPELWERGYATVTRSMTEGIVYSMTRLFPFDGKRIPLTRTTLITHSGQEFVVDGTNHHTDDDEPFELSTLAEADDSKYDDLAFQLVEVFVLAPNFRQSTLFEDVAKTLKEVQQSSKS